MGYSLERKVVWITGASSGIGAATARMLADRGAIPVLTARSPDKLERVSAQIRGEHAAWTMDVTDERQADETAGRIWERYGRLDILLNNAGYGEFVPFAEADLEHFQGMMDVNYFGVIRCTKAALKYMLTAGDGHIVNVASLAGKIGTPKASGYAATKYAVIGLTESLRQELRHTGIAVSAVNPGPVATAFFDRADPSGSYLRNLGPFVLKPERVARAIIRVMETRAPEINLPWPLAAGAWLMRAFPRLTAGVAARILDRK